MRNVFDQYTQPENRLTHSLVTVLHEDRTLLKSFLKQFGPRGGSAPKNLHILEQSLPGRPEWEEADSNQRGLPDAVIYDDDGWILVIESKVSDGLTKDQLQRHFKTIQRCGFEKIYGLSITVTPPEFTEQGWNAILWKDIYSWAIRQRASSEWARRLVDYFNIAEGKMANDQYLKRGTLTEFSGVSFDPYTYLEGKRILRLLMEKIKCDEKFVRTMCLDENSGRPAITEGRTGVWDVLKFKPRDGNAYDFTSYPHCTVAVGGVRCEAMVTFPNKMSGALRSNLCGVGYDDFLNRLEAVNLAVKKEFGRIPGHTPIVRLMQRRYPGQRSEPIMDGVIEFDLRVAFGEDQPDRGPVIKRQAEWVPAVYDILSNKKSNIQMQLGICFFCDHCDALQSKDADSLFKSSFLALKGFVDPVLGE